MEELFDRAADSEVKPDGKMPQPWQPQQQQRQSGESYLQGGKKRNFQPSISEPAEAPKADKSKSDKDDKRTPAPWVSPELYETRKSEGKCIRCGSPKLKTFRCPKYTRANCPDNLAPPGEGKQIKRQRSFDSLDGNIRGNSTASDFTKAEGCLREPESSHVKSISVWNGKTGFIAHCPRSPDTRSTRSIAKNTSTHRLRRDKHLHVSTTSQ